MPEKEYGSKGIGGVTLSLRPWNHHTNAIHNLSAKQTMHLDSPIVLVPLSFPGCEEVEQESLSTKPAEPEA